MSCPRIRRTLALRAALAVVALGLAAECPGAAPGLSPTPTEAAMMQTVAGGHVLGFGPAGYVTSNGRYALSVAFIGANAVSPTSATPATSTGEAAAPLGRVSYAGLYDGVTLHYDAVAGGIVRSTWALAPGAEPGDIRLRYNRPLSLRSDGGISIAYETGEITESAPVAWQETGGRREPVAVAFTMLGEQEIGFALGPYDRGRPLVIDPVLAWNTFLGGSAIDVGRGVAVDGSGNVYVAGESDATWGSPVRTYTAGSSSDAFAAKLDASGSLVWNTFLGSSVEDVGRGVAVDGSGNVYVVGMSRATWGSPVRAFTPGMILGLDAFAAKLDASGSLVWNTFLGGTGSDEGFGIAVDGSGSVLVAGYSSATWGSPVRAYTAGFDAFAVKLDASGSLVWNTFLGSSVEDRGAGVAVDGSGNVYVAGHSNATWGSPVRAFTASTDAFAAKLDAGGSLVWHTFLGGSGSDDAATGVAVDAGGDVYVTGYSPATWGSPVRAYTAGLDAFAAKLDGSGSLVWNSFLGGSGDDTGSGVTVDGSGNVYVAGASTATWGSPVLAYTSGLDALAAKLDASGSLVWNTFMGASGVDQGTGVAVGGGDVYVTGVSVATWGSPVRAFTTSAADAFAVKILDTRTLTLGLAGGGSGTVSSVPPGIACPGDCDEPFDFGSLVGLPAVPSGGGLFAGWSGDPDCSDGVVTLTDDVACTATFVEPVVCPPAPPCPPVPPTAAQIIGLSADVEPGGRVRLEWETASEAGVTGFRVHRASDKAGPYTPISPFLPARGGAAAGARYRWLDLPGVGQFFYPLLVEHVDEAPRMYGPASARIEALRVFLPILPGR